MENEAGFQGSQIFYTFMAEGDEKENPVPLKRQRTHAPPPDLPSAARYEKSYMHRDILVHVFVAGKIVVTISNDGVVKFWDKPVKISGELTLLRQYKAHQGSITATAVSYDNAWLATAGQDNYLKFFDIQNVDLVQFKKMETEVTGLEWAFTREERPKLLVQHSDTVQVHDINGEVDKVMDLKGLLKYHHVSDTIFAITPDSIQFHQRDKVTALKFKESISIPLSACWHPREQCQLAVVCSDRQIRIFDSETGKLLKRFDESLNYYTDSFQRAHFYPSFIQRKCEQAEFDRKMAFEQGGDTSTWNCTWDETGEHFIFPSCIGIKIVHFQTNKLVHLIGHVDPLRYTHVALLAPVISTSLDLAASENPQAKKAVSDPLLIALAAKKTRFFILSRREPMMLERDIQNDLPDQQASIKPSRKHKECSLDPTKLHKAILRTTKGDITIRLYPQYAPLACENFVQLARRKYYDNVIFHRIIKAFMIQTGDPTGLGSGGESCWGEPFADEFSGELKHDKPLTVSMANSGPKTNGSQFFITTVKCPWLDNKHTIFGRVIDGADTVYLIEHVEVGKYDKPVGDAPKILQIDLQLDRPDTIDSK